MQALTVEDMRRLLKQFGRSSFRDIRDIRDEAIIRLFLDSGLRLSELADLTLDKLDLVDGTVAVIGKGSKRAWCRSATTPPGLSTGTYAGGRSTLAATPSASGSGGSVRCDAARSTPWLAGRDKTFTLALIVHVAEAPACYGPPAPTDAVVVESTRCHHRVPPPAGVGATSSNPTRSARTCVAACGGDTPANPGIPPVNSQRSTAEHPDRLSAGARMESRRKQGARFARAEPALLCGVPITSEEAVAAVAATMDSSPEGSFVASAVGGSLLWSVHIEDPEGRPAAGGAWLVGPDGQVFSISSNQGIHDWDLAVRLLAAIYHEGVGDAVDPASFSDRLHRLTQDREQLVRDVVAEAKAGALRVVRRSLP